MNTQDAINNVRGAQLNLEAAQEYFSEEGRPRYPKLITITNDLRDVIRQIEGDMQATPETASPPAPPPRRPARPQDETPG